jgi:Na+(H+)/acetate symporter ActP
MQIHEHLGHAGLSGWRKTVADVVAPRVPIDDDQARMLVGLGFFVLSIYYVVGTVTRAVRRS